MPVLITFPNMKQTTKKISTVPNSPARNTAMPLTLTSVVS